MKFEFNERPSLSLYKGFVDFEDEANNLKKYLYVPEKIGMLNMPSGMLVISDPFSEMKISNNYGIMLPPNRYNIFTTLSYEIPENFRLKKTNSTEESIKQIRENLDYSISSISIVIDNQRMKQRMEWQYLTGREKNNKEGIKPVIDKEFLRYIHLTLNGHQPLFLSSMKEKDFTGVKVSSGTCCLVDAMSIKENLGDTDSEEWYENYFAYENDNSWLEKLDSDSERSIRKVANIELPKKHNFNLNTFGNTNIIMCESGAGDGYYPIIGEYACLNWKSENGPLLIALHVDFLTSPSSQDADMAKNSGER